MSPLAGLTLERMRALLRKGLGGLDSTDLPDLDTDELLNLSLWDLSDKFGFKAKECVVTASTVASQREYALPNDLDALMSVGIRDFDRDTWIKLERMSFDRFDEIRDDESDVEAKPLKYLRRVNTLVVNPTPDRIYLMQLTFWRTLPSLLSGVVDATGLPRNWDEMVVEGAIVRGHFYAQDYTEARQAANFQIGKVRSAELAVSKEEKHDSRYARLRVIEEFPDDNEPFLRKPLLGDD